MPPSTRVRGRWVAPDGTPALTSRYRAGEHTPDTRAAHAADTTSWRRTLADAEFSPELRARFLDLLRETGTVKATARGLGLTPQRVYGRMTRDAQFAAAVEERSSRCPARAATGAAPSAATGLAAGAPTVGEPSAPPADFLSDLPLPPLL